MSVLKLIANQLFSILSFFNVLARELVKSISP